MVTFVTDNGTAWDEFLRRHGGSFLQSWGWSRFQESLGRRVWRMRISEDGDTRLQALFVERDLPFGFRSLAAFHGPVGGGEGEARAAMVSALRDLGRKDRALLAKVELPFGATATDGDDLARRGFRRGRHTQPERTLVVDLSASDEAILGALHHKTRYNIRLAERRGVSVREAGLPAGSLAKAGSGEFEIFWRMLGETAERDRFHVHPRAHYEKMLASASDEGLAVRLFVAEAGGEAVAAGIFAEFGGTMTYLHGASSSARRELMAPHLLHWEAMREAKRRGLARYDFWGIAPTDDARHPLAGVTRFKKGFGGQILASPGAWELPLRPFWYILYRAAKRLKG